MTAVGTLVSSEFDVADKMYQMALDAKEELLLEDVWYGPQVLIPRYPCLIVEPRPKKRTLSGTHRWEVTFMINLLLYHGKVQTVDVTRRDNQEAAVLIENFYHADPTLGGIVIFGFINQLEPGIVSRGDVMVTATRLTWQGTSREGF